MTRYAHIDGGKVREIRETEMSWVDWCSIWDPTVFWIDVTGVENVKVGSVVKFHPERGTYFEDPEEIPYQEETLESKKSGKEEYLKFKFDSAVKDAFVDSSLGFRANANEEAIRAIGGLVTLSETQEEISFCDFDNLFHDLNTTELKVLYNEVLVNFTNLKEQKWKYRDAIMMVTSEEELNAIDIEFEMMAFPLQNYR